MALKAVLFDNDGTLVDTYELLMECFRVSTREVLGAALPDDVLSFKIGQPLVVQVLDFTDDAEAQQRIVEVYREHNARMHDSMIREFPGAREALARLAGEGLAMGVVTAKVHSVAWHGLELMGLAPYLSCLVGSNDCVHPKPAPDPVLMACDMLGVAPAECAYVGDSPYDIEAGNAAGCTSVAVTWGMFSEERLREANPALTCASFEELADALLARV